VALSVGLYSPPAARCLHPSGRSPTGLVCVSASDVWGAERPRRGPAV